MIQEGTMGKRVMRDGAIGERPISAGNRERQFKTNLDRRKAQPGEERLRNAATEKATYAGPTKKEPTKEGATSEGTIQKRTTWMG